MLKPKVQYVIALARIRMDDAVWLDLLLDDGNPCLASAIGYHHNIYFPVAV